MDNEKIMKKLRAMLLKDKKLKEILKEYLFLSVLKNTHITKKE